MESIVTVEHVESLQWLVMVSVGSIPCTCHDWCDYLQQRNKPLTPERSPPPVPTTCPQPAPSLPPQVQRRRLSHLSQSSSFAFCLLPNKNIVVSQFSAAHFAPRRLKQNVSFSVFTNALRHRDATEPPGILSRAEKEHAAWRRTGCAQCLSKL